MERWNTSKTRVWRSVITGLAIVAASQSAWAWPPKYGPEFNFSNKEIKRKFDPDSLNNGINSVFQLRFRDEVANRCPECLIEKFKDERIGERDGDYRYRVKHRDGWSFTISLDPMVVEVQADPMTLEEARAAAPEMQRLIFEAAGAVGLNSEKRGGQVHIGVRETFGEDPLYFSNFLKDWYFHSRMAFYLFGGDSGNSPTVDMVGSHPHGNLKQIFRMFDERFFGIVRPLPDKNRWLQKWDEFQKSWSVIPPDDYFRAVDRSNANASLREAIIRYVYFRSRRDWSPAEKYQNVKLTENTIELRSVTEAQSAEQYVALLELLQGRLEYVKRFTEPLEYKGIEKSWMPEDLLRLYAKFSRDAGLSWEKATSLTLERYHQDARKKPYACMAIFSDR